MMLLTGKVQTPKKSLKEAGKTKDFTITFISSSALSAFIFSAGVCGGGSIVAVVVSLIVYYTLTGIWKANNSDVAIPLWKKFLMELIGASIGCCVYIIGNHF